MHPWLEWFGSKLVELSITKSTTWFSQDCLDFWSKKLSNSRGALAFLSMCPFLTEGHFAWTPVTRNKLPVIISRMLCIFSLEIKSTLDKGHCLCWKITAWRQMSILLIWQTISWLLKYTRQEMATENIEEYEYPIKRCWTHHQKVVVVCLRWVRSSSTALHRLWLLCFCAF